VSDGRGDGEAPTRAAGKPDRLGEDGGENPSATSWCRGRLSECDRALEQRRSSRMGTSARLAHETGRAPAHRLSSRFARVGGCSREAAMGMRLNGYWRHEVWPPQLAKSLEPAISSVMRSLRLLKLAPFILFVVTVAACATPQTTPSAALTTLEPAAGRWFKLDWAAPPDGTDTRRVEGYIVNTSGQAAQVPRLAQAPPAPGQVADRKIAYALASAPGCLNTAWNGKLPDMP